MMDEPLQIELLIPGAREADEEAEATRYKDLRDLAARQAAEKPQSAFAVPKGPLFNLFQIAEKDKP